MEIKISKKDGATVVALSGCLDGATVDSDQEQILPLLSSKISLVLDLKECGYISSAGLRLLLMAAKQLSTQNGVLVLCGLAPEIKDVMEMTGFNNFLKSYDSVTAAIDALNKEA